MTAWTAIWVGIDVGKTNHHACAVDADGKVVFSQRVVNDQAAIEQLLARAHKAAGEVRWAIDLTSNAATLLIAILLTGGHQVLRTGRVVNRMTGVSVVNRRPTPRTPESSRRPPACDPVSLPFPPPTTSSSSWPD